MGLFKASESTDNPPTVNTAQHEKVLSEVTKTMTGACIDMSMSQLNHVIERCHADPAGVDPLALERYIHNADKLLSMAERTWALSESAFTKSRQLFKELKEAKK